VVRTAACLKRRAGARKALPSLLVFTDPARTPDPVALARRMPRGAGLVYRAFGASDAVAVARRLKAVARARGLLLLIGADAKLAARIGTDGVHLPERLAHRAQALRRRGWLVTAAAHSTRSARAPGVDAVVISAVFPSNSASAGAPIGPVRLAMMVRAAGRPAYALGGVTDKTARRLLPTGVVGIAAVEAFRT
jgi:thiamine-phosphate pyrophosphorylase